MREEMKRMMTIQNSRELECQLDGHTESPMRMTSPSEKRWRVVYHCCNCGYDRVKTYRRKSPPYRLDPETFEPIRQ